MKKLASILLISLYAFLFTMPISAYKNPDGEETSVHWVEENYERFILDENGNEIKGWYKDDLGDWYYFKRDNDRFFSGWLSSGGNWYYILPYNHQMYTGWLYIDSNTRYYMSEDSETIGIMQKGKKEIAGIIYDFGESGIVNKEYNINEDKLGYLAKQLNDEYTKEIYVVFDQLSKIYAGEYNIGYSSIKFEYNKEPKETQSALLNAFVLLRKENPLYSDLGNFTILHTDYMGGTRVSLNLQNRIELTKDYNEYKKVSDEILAEAKKLSDPYDQIKFIHDVLIDRIEYDRTYTKGYIRNALLEGKAVCQGYANTFAYFMDGLDIENIIVTGIGNRSAHAWNYVKLGDEWYAVDVTWDDTAKTNKYFLKGQSFLKDHKEEPIIEGVYYPTLSKIDYHNK